LLRVDRFVVGVFVVVDVFFEPAAAGLARVAGFGRAAGAFAVFFGAAALVAGLRARGAAFAAGSDTAGGGAGGAAGVSAGAATASATSA